MATDTAPWLTTLFLGALAILVAPALSQTLARTHHVSTCTGAVIKTSAPQLYISDTHPLLMK
jgi:hypothetical protein